MTVQSETTIGTKAGAPRKNLPEILEKNSARTYLLV
jgi:hypothetical protein